MATPTNGNGNLVDEFEEAFQACLNVLTKQEATPSTDKEEIKVEVDNLIQRFIDLGRQMEAFFLQKRFLLSALKPELVYKEDNNELKLELNRKDEVIKRHYEKIDVWKNLLADVQGWAKSPVAQGHTPTGIPNGGAGPAAAIPSAMPPNTAQMGVPGIQSPMQAQMQQAQQLQQAQLQQQHLQQIQQQQQQLQMQQQAQHMQQMQPFNKLANNR